MFKRACNSIILGDHSQLQGWVNGQQEWRAQLPLSFYKKMLTALLLTPHLYLSPYPFLNALTWFQEQGTVQRVQQFVYHDHVYCHVTPQGNTYSLTHVFHWGWNVIASISLYSPPALPISPRTFLNLSLIFQFDSRDIFDMYEVHHVNICWRVQ